MRTTSRELHETLDSRYCSKRHNHQPIERSIRYLGRRINLSHRVEKRFKFGSFERKEYTGISFLQLDDFSIEYDQISYVDQIPPIIPRIRQQQLHAEVSETERSELRSLVGTLQYAAVHTGPDISAKVGALQ